MPTPAKTELRTAGKHLQKALAAFGRLARTVASDAAVGASRAGRAACEKAIGALEQVEAKMATPAEEPKAKAKAKAKSKSKRTTKSATRTTRR